MTQADPPSSVPAYYANCVPGIEAVAGCEIRRKLPGVQIARIDPGRVLFGYAGDVSDLLSLRTTEDVFAYLAEMTDIPPDEQGLQVVKDHMRRIDLTCGLRAHSRLWGAPDRPTFRVTATRQGQHAFHSPQIAGWAGAGVVEQRGWPVSLEHPDIDIWVELRHDKAVCGVRLSTNAMGRRSRVVHSIASLRPTVAHAMCLLSRPTQAELFLDPMCGAGTMLIERQHDLPGAVVIGADKYTLPVQQAAANIRAAGVRASLVQADATRLALAAASVDKIVSNLPWGRRIGSHRTDRWLYPRFLSEANRVLRPGGTMVLLSLERRLMLSLLERMPGLHLVSRTMVTITGMRPSIYVLERQ